MSNGIVLSSGGQKHQTDSSYAEVNGNVSGITFRFHMELACFSQQPRQTRVFWGGIFQQKKIDILKTWCSYQITKELQDVFGNLMLVVGKVGRFIPRGIKKQFFKKFDQKYLLFGDLLVLQENIVQIFLCKANKNLNMSSVYLFKY